MYDKKNIDFSFCNPIIKGANFIALIQKSIGLGFKFREHPSEHSV